MSKDETKFGVGVKVKDLVHEDEGVIVSTYQNDDPADVTIYNVKREKEINGRKCTVVSHLRENEMEVVK